MKEPSIGQWCRMKRGSQRYSRRNLTSRSKTLPSVQDGSPPADIWSLPEEILLHVLSGMHIKDLLNMCSVHPYFCDLMKSHPAIWNQASFRDTWPSVPNMKHFNTAAKLGNFEALVKLAVAFLYNEGLPGDFEGQKITANGEKAAEMFCKVEAMMPSCSPFSWLFIRPPWAVAGACCKECVFNNMKNYVNQTPDPSIHICIAKTMEVLDVEGNKQGIRENLEKAAALGSSEAAYLLWTSKWSSNVIDRPVLDCAEELHRIRELRQIACVTYPTAQLALCTAYVMGQSGGYPREQTTSYVRKFIQSSEPSDVKDIYEVNELTHSMRYILVDWLVEVACMKDFSSLTLHMAVSVVDRYLQRHKTTRSMLQLLGVAAMVLCSRFLGKEIITIREAAWLTDNTYKYEDVVRMMGEITATLKGKFRVVTSLDYVRLLNLAAGSERVTCLLAEYYCELALLQSDVSALPRAQVASACVLLARFARFHDCPWPRCMNEFTGCTLQDMVKPTLLLHEKCFLERALVDHRDVVLQAVKERYVDEDFCGVSKIPVISKGALRGLLGVPVETATPGTQETQTPAKKDSRCCLDPKDLIASPCRPGASGKSKKTPERDLDRNQAATPSMDSMADLSYAGLNESAISGYDGDREDEGDSFFEGYDSDPDLESLWCVDGYGFAVGSKANISMADISSAIGSDESCLGIPAPPPSPPALPCSAEKARGESLASQVRPAARSALAKSERAKGGVAVIGSPVGKVGSVAGVRPQAVPASPTTGSDVIASHVGQRVRIHVHRDPHVHPRDRKGVGVPALAAEGSTPQGRPASPRVRLGPLRRDPGAFTSCVASKGDGRFALQTLSTCNQASRPTDLPAGKVTAGKRKSRQEGPISAKVKVIASK